MEMFAGLSGKPAASSASPPADTSASPSAPPAPSSLPAAAFVAPEPIVDASDEAKLRHAAAVEAERRRVEDGLWECTADLVYAEWKEVDARAGVADDLDALDDLDAEPKIKGTHDITDNSESPDCPSNHFNT